MNFIPVETGLLFQEEKPLPAVLAACGDDEEARAAIRKLSMDQLTALVEAWGEESGAAAGE